MPYHLTREPDLVRLVYFGVITPPDLQSIADELKAIEQAHGASLNRLIDLTQASRLELTYPVLRPFTAQRMAQPSTNQVKSAIVAPQPVHVGFARMYQTLNDYAQFTIKIFSTVADAEAWLRPE
jgi:hypothetical protein